MKNELTWNQDMIQILREELKTEYPQIKVISGKVLKDIFLVQDKNGNHKIQFGFVDQDIVLFDKTIDFQEFKDLRSGLVHNMENKGNDTRNGIENENYQSIEKNELIIPKLIIELKYNGVTSHGLITYSEYASDIKSIFPECKYWLAVRFRKSSSENKLLRHGKYMDKILSFSDKTNNQEYALGDFKKELSNDKDLQKVHNELIEEVKKTLDTKKTSFIK